MENVKERTIDFPSPEMVLERYLAQIRTQIEGGQIEGQGIYDNHRIPFGIARKEAEQLLQLVQERGYEFHGSQSSWSESEQSKEAKLYCWRKRLLDLAGYIVIQIGNYPIETHELLKERAAWISFHPYGPEAKKGGLKFTDQEARQRLAQEVLKIMDIFLNEKIPFSVHLGDFSEFGNQILKVDFPKGKREILVVPFVA